MQEAFYSPTIEKAIELAAEWHAGTYRKGRWRTPSFTFSDGTAPRIPVMSHVTAVALTVQRAGWDENTVAAAFLHDILEDPNQEGQTMSFAELSHLIGDVIAGYVLAVSEEKKDKQGKPQLWKARKIGYIEGLQNHGIEAAAISLADKIHNLWSMNNSMKMGIDLFTTTPSRKGLSAGPEEQVWFYEAVYKATLRHNDPRILPMQKKFNIELERFRDLSH